MGLLFAIVLIAAFLAVVFVLPSFHYWKRLGDEQITVEEWKIFLRWAIAGNVVPFVLWFLFNTGIIGPPVWPTIPPLNAGISAWWKSFGDTAGSALFLISSYWAGITFVWLLGRAFGLAENPRVFFISCGSWSVLLVPLAVGIILGLGWSAFGVALMIYCLPLVHTTLDLKPPPPLPPSYSRALAKINFGKYAEAEQEVIRELEECEDDFNGWMMLAELYATHFDDLRTADETVHDLCAQESTTPTQMSIALQKLADWYLKIARDPVRARAVLEEICARLPGAHLDKMARQRIAQLPASRAELLEREQGKPLHLPHVPDEIIPQSSMMPREQAALAANECVEVLKKNPDDVPAREKFARLLAESLGKAESGIEQLELLLAMPKQPPRKRGEWLLNSGLWYARYLDDTQKAKLIYEQVLRDFRDTPHAFTAQQRINLINLQSQFQKRFAERAKL